MMNACGRSAYAEYSHSVCVYIYIYIYIYMALLFITYGDGPMVHHLDPTNGPIEPARVQPVPCDRAASHAIITRNG
jgi:hypothetical protein